jgi:hypothetical protein
MIKSIAQMPVMNAGSKAKKRIMMVAENSDGQAVSVYPILFVLQLFAFSFETFICDTLFQES